jgi:hypothetical protein
MMKTKNVSDLLMVRHVVLSHEEKCFLGDELSARTHRHMKWLHTHALTQIHVPCKISVRTSTVLWRRIQINFRGEKY